jgi:drug/metabolite transporter (DMT)-like permease
MQNQQLRLQENLLQKPVVKPPPKFSVVVALMNGSMFMFTFNNVFGKSAMNKEVGYANFWEYTFVRMWFMTIASYLWLYGLKIKITDVPSDKRLLLFFRCSVGTANFLVTAYALKVLPLSIYTIIISTNPFMTALLQYFWTSQKITISDGVSMVGSFAGIVLMGLSAPTSTASDSVSSTYLLGIMLSVLGAVFLAFIFVSTNQMKSIHYLVISFYLGTVGGVACTIGMMVQYFSDGRTPF